MAPKHESTETTPPPVHHAPGIDAQTLALAFAEAMRLAQPKSALELAGLTKAQELALVSPNPPRPTREVTVEGEHGNRIRVVVSASERWAQGVVTSFAEYTYPSGVYTHESSGGLVPDGIPILKDGGSPASGRVPEQSELSPMFTMWRTREVYLVDHRALIGKPLRTHQIIEDAAVDVAAE